MFVYMSDMYKSVKVPLETRGHQIDNLDLELQVTVGLLAWC